MESYFGQFSFAVYLLHVQITNSTLFFHISSNFMIFGSKTAHLLYSNKIFVSL